MESVGSFEAGANLPRLLERVARGEEFTITEHGRAVARLVPVGPVGTKPDVRRVIADLREFRKGNTLGEGLTIREMIDEGRRF